MLGDLHRNVLSGPRRRSRVLVSGCAPTFSALLLAACSITPRFTSLNSPPHSLTAKAGPEVELLTISPARPFVEVGEIDLVARGRIVSLNDETVELIRQEAGKRGCDAVVVDAPAGRAMGACLVYVSR